MAFDRARAEDNLQNILNRVRGIHNIIQRDIIDYRRQDTLVSEEDESKTLRDIRFYLLRAHRETDELLRQLDKYR